MNPLAGNVCPYCQLLYPIGKAITVYKRYYSMIAQFPDEPLDGLFESKCIHGFSHALKLSGFPERNWYHVFHLYRWSYVPNVQAEPGGLETYYPVQIILYGVGTGFPSGG